jgi:XTP/dITP diphosphohydrolase
MIDFRIATTNAGKLREFQQLLHPLGIEVRGVGDLNHQAPEETGDNFTQNALIKAQALFNTCQEPTLADDSGLVVDALGGEPGLFSARYAGVGPPHHDSANRAKLLTNLDGLPSVKRRARFICALAFIQKDTLPQFFEGSMEGHIAETEIGEQGFGYDSIFIPEGQALTAAQMTPQQKNARSHRSRALESFIAWWSSERTQDQELEVNA